MLRFWTFLIQNYNCLTLKQWLKKIKRIVKWVEKVESSDNISLRL